MNADKKSSFSFDIVIPQYKDIEALDACLSSISRYGVPDSLGSIIIVENGGVYGAEIIVEKFSTLLPMEYLYLETGNLSLARNTGAAHSKAKFVLYLDNDTAVQRYTLQAYETAMVKYPDAALFGGPVLPDYESIPPEWLIEFLPPSAKGFHPGENDSKLNSAILLGGNHAINRKKVIEIGGYDSQSASGQNSGGVGEETRLQEKLMSEGQEIIYLAKALVYHRVPEENCTPKWALQRAKRHGATLACQQSNIPGRKLYGVPYYHLKHFILSVFPTPRKLLSKSRRFQYKMDLVSKIECLRVFIENRNN